MSDAQKGASRRQFLFGGAVAAAGVAAGFTADRAIVAYTEANAPVHGEATVPFYGAHQAGIATDAQANATLIAFDLHDDTDREALGRMMRILTDDAARLTQGRPALADTEPELALEPARLTITFGFGPKFVERAGGTGPEWLRPLPAFGIDKLEARYSDGDLLIQVASDDATSMAHAVRMLIKDARGFGTLRWQQRGFRHAHGTRKPGVTMRNLFGQIDGTTNASPETDDFNQLVWIKDGWLAGGTSFVLRRIAMDLETWDLVGRRDREESVGRTLETGAPLTGGGEFDEPDFDALHASGHPVIARHAHMRRARSDDPRERFFRRAYNYDEAPTGDASSNSGLLFIAMQADVDRQFVPIQRQLAELDILNLWTTPTGSAVFAIPPGCAEAGFIGETLLG